MNNPTIDAQMLSALELLHYCKRFEDSIFAFVFEEGDHCGNVLTDLRVLLAARVRQAIFCAKSSSLQQALESWNRSGDRFVVIDASREDLEDDGFFKRVEEVIVGGNAPFVALSDFPKDVSARCKVDSAIVGLSTRLGATKVFFAGKERGLELDGKLSSYPTAQEVNAALARGARSNIPTERVRCLVDQQHEHEIDIVLVEARTGAIFEEVFTHSGSGTLLSREYPNIMRPAQESDVRDIMALMQPYISEGLLKAMKEEELLAMIKRFSVYSVNGQIVAAAALFDYGDSCELAKLCTLPRFQARGRARALVIDLLNRARQSGKKSVFALTVQSYVGDFFERIGFQQVDRADLPEDWKRNYDFSRPSKAYHYKL